MRTVFVYSIYHRVAFVIGLAYVILMNYLANAIPFGGQTTADISNLHPTLITPAGYAFSIWGLIYLSFAVFAYYQLRRGKDVRFFRMAWPWAILNFIANGLWLLAFQNEWFAISVVLMLFMLFTLFQIFRMFYRLKRAISTTNRFFFQVPFSIYFGWLSIASVVNVAVWLKTLNNASIADGELMIALIMLTVAATLGLLLVLRFQDYIYALTIVWALVAIWQNPSSIEVVANYSKVAAFVLAGFILGIFVMDRIKVAQYGRTINQ